MPSSNNACSRYEAEIDRIIKEAEAELQGDLKQLEQQLEEDANDLEEDAPDTEGPDVVVDLDIDVGWQEQKIDIPFPKVTTVDKKIGMHVPQATMKSKKISFKVPETVMVRKRTGSKPVTKCKTKYKKVLGKKIPYPSCSTSWEPLYANVPEIRMKTKSINVSYPEIKMDRTDFVVGIPEITMETRKVIFHTPTITVKRISVSARETEERAEEMEREFNEDTEAAVAEFRSDVAERLQGPHAAMFDCYREDVIKNRDHAVRQFEAPLKMLSDAIHEMKHNETDEDDAQIRELQKQRDSLVDQSKKVQKEFEAALASLDDSQQKSLQAILSGFAP